MITDLLLKTRDLYQETYPERVTHPVFKYMNCTITDPETSETMVDSGVCYAVAREVYLKLKAMGEEPTLVLLWSHYGPSGMSRTEPEPVHVCLELDGCYYDSVNTEGVPNATHLWAAGFMRCTEWSTLKGDGGDLFSKYLTRETPYNKALATL